MSLMNFLRFTDVLCETDYLDYVEKESKKVKEHVLNRIRDDNDGQLPKTIKWSVAVNYIEMYKLEDDFPLSLDTDLRLTWIKKNESLFQEYGLRMFMQFPKHVRDRN